jgi:hypothetical protein
MKSVIALLIFFGAATVFANNIVCEGTSSSSGDDVRIEIAKDSVILSGRSLERPRVVKNLTRVNGLITAPGLAITMENQYGCLRNAVIISEFREPLNAGYMEVINIGLCSGGSTSDEVCGIK